MADQFVGKNDIDVGGQDVLASSASYAGVLGDHLIQGQGCRVFVARVNLTWNLDESHIAGTAVFGPPKRVNEKRAVFGRVPIDYNQLGGKAVTLALADPGVHESLHTAKQTATMVIVPGGDDH